MLRKISTILLLLIFNFSLDSHSTVLVSHKPIAPELIKKNGPGRTEEMRQQMNWFAHLTIKDYEKLKGKKLNFVERIAFKLNQHRVRKLLAQYDWDGPTTFQKIAALGKGLVLGPIALILGYIFLKDDDRELIKWIWFGFAGWCILLALILLAA